MKKHVKKLTLAKETIGELGETQIQKVAGGATIGCPSFGIVCLETRITCIC